MKNLLLTLALFATAGLINAGGPTILPAGTPLPAGTTKFAGSDRVVYGPYDLPGQSLRPGGPDVVLTGRELVRAGAADEPMVATEALTL